MKIRLLGLAALAAGACVLAAPISSNASPVIPDETSSASVISNDPTTTTQSGTTQASLLDTTAFISLLPYVALEAQSTSTGIDYVGGQSASANLNYYFSVVGGPNGVSIPVDVATNLLTTASAEPVSGSAAFYGYASFIVGTARQVVACTDVNQCASTQFDGTVHLNVNSGDVVEVSIEIEALSDAAFAGTAFASADPLITIDPSFGPTGTYSIALSDGVGNGFAPAATPLPAALPLFATGIGAMALLGRRRKKKPAAFAA